MATVAEDSSLQSDELIRAVAAQADFDFAYHLQLQEALAASCDRHLYHDRPAHHQGETERAAPFSCSNDRAMALALQNVEIYQSQQREEDQTYMAREVQLLQLEIKRRAHDAKFAQSLMDMDEGEWEANGDVLQNPFKPEASAPSSSSSTGGSEPTHLCKLYFTVASSEDTTLRAVGAVVLDSQNNILTEVRKLLEPGTSKTAADYMALIAGLETVHAMGFQHVEAHTDSVLLYNQTCKIQGLWSQVMDYVHKLPAFHVFLDPRNLNQHAVRLAREAISAVSDDMPDLNPKKGSQVCTICLEAKHQTDIFKLSECLHEFCRSCIIQHAEVKVQAGRIPICCPQFGCTSTLGLAQCQSILSQRWYDLLSKRLIEANIPESQRVYCPFPNCSALMDKRDIDAINSSSSASSSTVTARKKCIVCARIFCVECRVPWHTSMSCQYYQTLPPELRDAQDAKLYQLADNQKWQRCKMCRRMIELSEGCYHMTCRCGYEFCYLCGEQWKDKAQTCQCRLWDEGYLLHERIPDLPNEAVNFNNDVLEDFEVESYGDHEDFDEVNGRSDFLYLSPGARNWLYKTKLCRHWVRGVCFAGKSCKFAHGTHELR